MQVVDARLLRGAKGKLMCTRLLREKGIAMPTLMLAGTTLTVVGLVTGFLATASAQEHEWVPGLPPPVEPLPPVERPPPVEKKWDCLAGLCLNSKSASKIPRSVVTVSEHKWARDVEVCSGRIVAITIQITWYQEGFVWTDSLPGTSIKLGTEGDGAQALRLYERVIGVFLDKGWERTPLENGDMFLHPGINGRRGAIYDRAHDRDEPNGWIITLISGHPDRATLCKAQIEQGL